MINFSIDSASTCPVSSSTSSPATLAAGTSCKELLSFTPTQVGAISGKLTLVDDSLNAAAPNYANQIILLNGTGSMAAPTISFSVADQIYGASPFAVTATSNSTGAFTYSVVSGPATISGNTVTLTGTGSVTLKASQAATSQYSAGSATTTFQVSAGTPVITFSVANQVYGTPPFTVTATSKLSRGLHLLRSLRAGHNLRKLSNAHRRRLRYPPGLTSRDGPIQRRLCDNNIPRRDRNARHLLLRSEPGLRSSAIYGRSNL